MFREMRRARQAVSAEECQRILQTEGRGVLSLAGDDGYPYGLPMNFYYAPEDNAIYFHTGKAGHKLDAIRRCDKACFTVWQQTGKDPGDWAWHVTSVIAMGRAECISDPARTEEMVRRLALKYYPDADAVEAEIRAAIQHVQLVALHIEHMTGKQIHEK